MCSLLYKGQSVNVLTSLSSTDGRENNFKIKTIHALKKKMFLPIETRGYWKPYIKLIEECDRSETTMYDLNCFVSVCFGVRAMFLGAAGIRKSTFKVLNNGTKCF